MNERIKELMNQAGTDCSGKWMGTTHIEKFAELIIRECSSRCGSQADQRNILKSFGIEVESNIKYPSPERHWSIKSQYDREYNLPKGVTNDGVK
jgi:hypothetical protein